MRRSLIAPLALGLLTLPLVTSAAARPPDTALNVYAATRGPDLSPAVVGVPDRIYVPNSKSDTLYVIDPLSYRVVDEVPVGHEPHHVTPAWDLRALYVLNTQSDSISVVDPRSGKVTETIAVPDPYNLYFTPDGSAAIVIAERYNRLDFRDPHTWQLLGSVPIAHAGVDHLDFSADGRYALVSCEYSGWVVKVDTKAMAVTGEVHVRGLPIDVKLSPDGRVFYVANQARDGVSIVDPVALAEIGFLHTGGGAHGLYVSRDTRSLYVTNRKAGTISVVDFATRRVVKTWHTGGSPDMGGVSTDGTRLWLSGRFSREVYVIDTRTGRLLRVIRVGLSPHGLALFPQPGRVSLGHTGVYR